MSSSSSKRSRKKQPAWNDACATAPIADQERVVTAEAAPQPAGGARWIHAAVAGLLIALCAGLYAWTADFPMAFDDDMYMKNNALFHDASSFNYPSRFVEFANLPAKIGGDPDLATNFMMRPVAYASLRLNYMFDGFNPRWFRVVNIGIHAISSLLIYALLRHLLRHGPKAASLPRGSDVFIPATAAMLFAAHPLATESVTYIIQRFTSLSTMFYLLTLWLYFVSLNAASRTGRSVLRIVAVVPLVLGMFTKECTFTAPLMAVLIDCVVNGARLRAAAWRALPLLLCLPVIPALVMLTSVAQHEGRFSLATAFNLVNSRDNPLDHWHYVVSQITVVEAYLQRIFWPAGLNLDPEWPLYRSLLAAPVLKALVVLAALVTGSFWLWRRHPRDAHFSLAFVFTLWFFITVSVSSGIVPLPDLMADHRAYLPSVGIFILVACSLDFLRVADWRPSIVRVAVPVFTILCVGALAWTTCARNEVWRTLESLWADTVAKSPGKFRTWGNMGAAYSTSGKEEEAVKCYQEALKIEPRFQPAMFNLSNSLLRLGRPKESLDTSLKLIQMDQRTATQPQVVYTVGLGLAGVGRSDEAITVFNQILAVMPEDARCHQALGTVYLQTNKPALALDHFRTASQLMTPDGHLLACIRMAEEAMAKSLPRPASSLPFRLRLQ